MAEEKGLVAVAKKTEVIETLQTRYSCESIASLPVLQQTVMIAQGLRQMREAVKATLLPEFMALQGTNLGFRTDKDQTGGYPAETVLEVAVHALLSNLRPIGNEFNVIAGRLYVTKEGYERKVREIPGLSDLRLNAGVPVLKQGGCVVPYELRWCLNGQPSSHKMEIPVRTAGNQGADAALGKAKRKALAWLFSHIKGSNHTGILGDLEDEPGEGAPATTAATTPIAAVSDAAPAPARKSRTEEVRARLEAEARANAAANREPEDEPGVGDAAE